VAVLQKFALSGCFLAETGTGTTVFACCILEALKAIKKKTSAMVLWFCDSKVTDWYRNGLLQCTWSTAAVHVGLQSVVTVVDSSYCLPVKDIKPMIHTTDADDATQLSSWVASAVCIEFATNSRRIWSRNWKLNMLRIYPVELAAELETRSRLPTDWMSKHRPTQLNSTRHVQFSIFLPNPSAVVVS